MNLVVNARDAIAKRGRISVRARRVDARTAPDAGLPEGDLVLLSVRDDGQGMPREVVSRLFEAFFTTKPPGEGTGLGLATVRGILDQTGGTIRVHTEVGKGSEFRVYWPRLAQAAPAPAPVETTPVPARGTGTVLVVEDDPLVRGVVTELLRRHGYTVLEAADGVQGLEVAARHEGPIHALVSDVVMPRMHGPELAEAIRAARPDIGILLLSGYAEDLADEGAVERLGAVLLAKPFRAEDLFERVREVLR
jgi:CheY-like chemotaxis protein